MNKVKLLGCILISLPFTIYLCLMVTVYGLQDVLIAAGYVLGFLLMWFSLMLGIALLTDGQD